jgi:hypothetical protein
MDPQSAALALAHMSSQLTPLLAASLLTMAANSAVECAVTDGGGAICPDAKAMVVGKVFFVLAPHPVNGKSEKPHTTNRNSPSVGRGRKTNLRFISIVSTNASV